MNPLFSIVIPTKDRPELLAACLTGLSQLDYPRENYEVLVVDDGSESSMFGVCEQFLNKFTIEYFRQVVSSGPAAARNFGAENALGRYLVFLDDDCSVDPKWLGAYEAGFSKIDADALVGSTHNPDPDMIGPQVWCLVVAFQYHYWRDESGYLKIAISNNLAVERQAFQAVGGFDGSFPLAASEDRDFSWRFNEAGYRIAQSPEAKVWHIQPSLSFSKYMKLQFRYGYYAGAQKRKRKLANVAESSRRFGNPSRFRYAIQLLRFALVNNAKPIEILVLYLGHISHYFGRLIRNLQIR